VHQDLSNSVGNVDQISWSD